MFKGKLTDREMQVRLMRFLTVGCAAALVQFSTLAGIRNMSGPTQAFSIAFVLGLVAHYTLNRFWALPSARTDAWKQFLEYLATAGLSYLINLGVFMLGREVFGLSVVSAGVLAWPPSMVIVFLLLNYRVFRCGHRPSPNG